MPLPLTDAQIADYFRRSYTAVDGLWFMKLEERADFATALQVDVAVWRVMPKIQARKLKELTGLGSGLADLRQCLTAKLAVEAHAHVDRDLPDGGFEVEISECPWVKLLAKSGRLHLADTIGQVICTAEYGVWAAEFGKNIQFEFGERLCQGCPRCVLRFSPAGEMTNDEIRMTNE